MNVGVSLGVVWCGVVWCGVVWCGVVWCGVVWCGVNQFVCVCPSVYLCVCMCMYVHLCTCLCVCIHVSVFVCLCTCVRKACVYVLQRGRAKRRVLVCGCLVPALESCHPCSCNVCMYASLLLISLKKCTAHFVRSLLSTTFKRKRSYLEAQLTLSSLSAHSQLQCCRCRT